ncbi:MAG: response regulator transcription factor [Spirochaetales bacterium]|jgi:two-component system, OmpR family, alkaline phosphatase synthesis response regulator PhoP|nr:response regulator transcription factor [Spirochaetales bacterium]
MKILVAEDDVYTRKGLVEVFEGEGYDVISAATGTQAIELYQKELPDFVCLDIMMPGKNGYDVCRDIRKLDSQVPVLFISAKSEEIDKVVGLELGADDYIVKPFGVREVLARVNAIQRRYVGGSESNDSTTALGDLEIIPSELRAYRDGNTIELSPRDVKLLVLFASNPGKVMNRNDLFDAGWGVDYLPSSRSLDQYISQLRKKIEVDPKNPELIVTVHSAGYRYPG